MSAPTLWEEGHSSGRRVVRLAITSGVLLAAFDLLISPSLGLVFDIGFVMICIAAALGVRKSDFFVIGVLPPLLMAGILLIISVFARDMLTSLTDSRAQAFVSGLTHRSAALVIGYGLCLLILAIRHQVLTKRARADRASHSKREGSPAPTLTTAGASKE